METTEADSEIEEEHLINFVVNSLNDEVVINLSEDVEVTTETFQSDDHGIAITEGTWEYGGLWDSDERVEAVDSVDIERNEPGVRVAEVTVGVSLVESVTVQFAAEVG